MKLFGLTTFESADSTPAAAWQSCFFPVMNLAQGTSSCLPSDQREKPTQVSSARRTSRCSSGLVHFQQMSKEVWGRGHPHTGDSLTAALPKTTEVNGRWNATFFSSLPEEETERVLGEEGYRLHVLSLFCVKVCGDIFMHSAIYIQYAHCTEMNWREVGVAALNFV